MYTNQYCAIEEREIHTLCKNYVLIVKWQNDRRVFVLYIRAQHKVISVMVVGVLDREEVQNFVFTCIAWP